MSGGYRGLSEREARGSLEPFGGSRWRLSCCDERTLAGSH